MTKLTVIVAQIWQRSSGLSTVCCFHTWWLTSGRCTVRQQLVKKQRLLEHSNNNVSSTVTEHKTVMKPMPPNYTLYTVKHDTKFTKQQSNFNQLKYNKMPRIYQPGSKLYSRDQVMIHWHSSSQYCNCHNKMPRYRREDRAMGALKKIASPWLCSQLISPTF